MIRLIWLLYFAVAPLFAAQPSQQALDIDFDPSVFEQMAEISQAENLEQTVGRDQDISCRLARDTYADFTLHFDRALKELDTNSAVTERLIFEYLRVVDRLLSDYPPSQFIYVGLGSSPTIIIAILETLKIINSDITTVDFPLSIREEKNDPALSKAVAKYLWQIFSPTINDARTYLLIDYIFTGKSLERAHNLLTKFFKKKKLAHQMLPLGLRKSDNLFPPKYQPAEIMLPRKVAWDIHDQCTITFRKYPKITLEDIENRRTKLFEMPDYASLKRLLATLRNAPMSRL